jgi:hypothetical protein
MFQRKDRGSLKYLVCKGTLLMSEVDWKRYRSYVLLREMWTWGSRDRKIIVLVGSNYENCTQVRGLKMTETVNNSRVI